MGVPLPPKPIILWWCPRCDIYFARVRTWTLSAGHRKEYRPAGPTGPIHGGGAMCGGIASPLRDGPILAAYIIDGLAAVYAMGLRVN